MKVEVAVFLGFPSLIINTYGLCGRKAALNLNRDDSEPLSCVKVKVAGFLGSPSIIILMVSVGVKQH